MVLGTRRPCPSQLECVTISLANWGFFFVLFFSFSWGIKIVGARLLGAVYSFSCLYLQLQHFGTHLLSGLTYCFFFFLPALLSTLEFVPARHAVKEDSTIPRTHKYKEICPRNNLVFCQSRFFFFAIYLYMAGQGFQ